MIPLDIFQEIVQYGDLKTNINMIKSSKELSNLKIYDLYNIPKYLQKKITQNILNQKKYSYLQKLSVSCLDKIDKNQNFEHNVLSQNNRFKLFRRYFRRIKCGK